MKDLNFPEISKEIQQSVYGAWGGSQSNDPNGGWYDNGDGITIITNPGGGSGGGSGDWGSGGIGDDGGDQWDQPGSGGGGGGSPDPAIADGILENPNASELWWLFTNTNEVSLALMAHNRDVALEYGRQLPGTLNGQGDALRHSMWSAMDAADLGLAKAREFHTLHETSNPDASNAMDLHNNNWGFQWFQNHGNPDGQEFQFVQDFLNAWNNGEIQTHP
ncbi:DUF6973 domain-containing protein [Flavobacterium limi]|uniref:DUF6973 domain-containing protein n=1 Tax=Flavobacterium limi TaxID=2045105 RepID=A0ABQ1UWU2_9FLAO|nr:hypothetical protein [Flavobacterium limi]GGF28107.1 hypothetical protein GCM10011518_41770 [Flavobacterium limi]